MGDTLVELIICARKSPKPVQNIVHAYHTLNSNPDVMFGSLLPEHPCLCH